MKKAYKYCTVVPKFRETDYYYYLDYSEKVKKGSYVIAPFGNDEIIGKVTKVENFEEENVPFPIDKMKAIRCVISKEEFDEYTYGEYVGADVANWHEFEELDNVIVKCQTDDIVGVIVDKWWWNDANDYIYTVEYKDENDEWVLQKYSCYELEKYTVLGKAKYIGETTYEKLLKNNNVYEIIGVQKNDNYLLVRVVDDTGNPHMYSWEDYTNPKNKSCDKWQIVEDVDGKLSRALKYPNTMPKADNGDNGPYDFLTWISYERFKNIYEKVNGEPEYYVYLENKPTEEYMIIRYKDGPTFQRCGVKDGSGEIEFENLDKLYESETIDGICLKRDWDKVRICPNGYESIEEFCWVHNIDLKI